MRNPDRIDGVIETIRKVWKLEPDWRLGQLICNLARDAGFYDNFFIEDDRLKEKAEEWLAQAEELAGDTE